MFNASSTTRVNTTSANSSPGKQPLSKEDIREILTSFDTAGYDDTLPFVYASADSVGSLGLPSLGDIAEYSGNHLPSAYASMDSMGGMGLPPLGDTVAGYGSSLPFVYASVDSMGSMGLPPLGDIAEYSGNNLPSVYASMDSVGSKGLPSLGDNSSFLHASVDSMGSLVVPPLGDTTKHSGMDLTFVYSSMDLMREIEFSTGMFKTADATPAPKKSVTPEWLGKYAKALEPEPTSVEVLKKKAKKPVTKKAVTTKPKSPSRRVESKEKSYFEPTELDILCGRGGRTNYHKGNEHYLAMVEKEKPTYRESVVKEKTIISQRIVDRLTQDHRRFLKLEDDTNGRWFEITKTAARRKVSQALREENTAASRAAKRQRNKK